MSTNYEIKENQQFNSLEVYFNEIPEKAIREALKALKFRWNHKKACWYGFTTTEALTIAIETGEIQETEESTTREPKKAAQKVNKYGVKVGDFFHMSWGYEQTNNDFFQVVALVGNSSVRVREVNPEIISRDGASGMSEHRTYNLDTTNLLPPVPHSIFINDNEKGDLKRVKSHSADGLSYPLINIENHTASHCKSETLRAYESWYA